MKYPGLHLFRAALIDLRRGGVSSDICLNCQVVLHGLLVGQLLRCYDIPCLVGFHETPSDSPTSDVLSMKNVFCVLC